MLHTDTAVSSSVTASNYSRHHAYERCGRPSGVYCTLRGRGIIANLIFQRNYRKES